MQPWRSTFCPKPDGKCRCWPLCLSTPSQISLVATLMGHYLNNTLVFCPNALSILWKAYINIWFQCSELSVHLKTQQYKYCDHTKNLREWHQYKNYKRERDWRVETVTSLSKTRIKLLNSKYMIIWDLCEVELHLHAQLPCFAVTRPTSNLHNIWT